MSSCAICSGLFKAPTALPCGHVYCYDCITKATRSSTSMSTTVCPTCRAPFSIAAVDVNLVPQHLRHYFLPPFRRIYLDTPAPPPHFSTSSVSPSPPRQLSARTTQLQAENRVLRESCLAWRQRAEAQAAASLGLAALIRVAKEQERTRRQERDEFSRKYDVLLKQISVSREHLPCDGCAAAVTSKEDAMDCSSAQDLDSEEGAEP